MTRVAYSALLSGRYRDKPLGEAYDHPGTTRRLEIELDDDQADRLDCAA
ncbi:hypothetical protein [Saccharothrix sp. 6-C]|nr:hypothetical protein [Saccharothrix sp. 6-C]